MTPRDGIVLSRNEEKILSTWENYWDIPVGTGCWLWKRAIADTGYGIIWNGRKLVGAHRFTFHLFKGDLPKGLDLDHLCRTRRCVNPAHLEPVTRTVNARRGANPVLTLEQVIEIRSLNEKGIGFRRLAKMFDAHRSTIQNAVKQRTWKDIAA